MARATATVETLSSKIPEVRQSASASSTSFWTGVTTAAGTVATAVVGNVKDAVDWLEPVKGFVGDVPWYVWLAAPGVVSLLLFYVSHRAGKAAESAVEAYQEGSRR